VLQDPDTGDRIWVTGTGHIYHRERPRVSGDQADVDRLNAALGEISDEAATAVIRDLGIVAAIVMALAAIIIACCSGPG